MTEVAQKRRLRRAVALVGLMGCGKSTVGARLARLLDAPFRDADAEIVKAAGMTIPEIFADFGEEEFRRLERRVIARLMNDGAMVLATGGGAYADAEARAAISAAGVAVWLKADLDTLVARTGRKSTRPLLRNGDPREILAGLMAKRDPYYAQAEIQVESSERVSADAVAQRIVEEIVRHDAGAPPDRRILEAAP